MTTLPTTIEEAHTLLLSAVLNGRPRTLPALSSKGAKADRVAHILNTAEAFRAYLVFAAEDTAAHMSLPVDVAQEIDDRLTDLISDLEGDMSAAMDDEQEDAA
jgi:hypothetical protein